MKGKMLRARKAMVPDDEITCDYGSDYFDLFIAPIGCRCAHAPRRDDAPMLAKDSKRAHGRTVDFTATLA